MTWIKVPASPVASAVPCDDIAHIGIGRPVQGVMRGGEEFVRTASLPTFRQQPGRQVRHRGTAEPGRKPPALPAAGVPAGKPGQIRTGRELLVGGDQLDVSRPSPSRSQQRVPISLVRCAAQRPALQQVDPGGADRSASAVATVSSLGCGLIQVAPASGPKPCQASVRGPGPVCRGSPRALRRSPCARCRPELSLPRSKMRARPSSSIPEAPAGQLVAGLPTLAVGGKPAFPFCIRDSTTRLVLSPTSNTASSSPRSRSGDRR